MKTFNIAKSPKCQDELRKVLEAHELVYNLFLEFTKRSKAFDDDPSFAQSLQAALKLVRNKKITWTYGMFLRSTYDVFYLIDVFKELYTPEIQEKMDVVTKFLTANLVVGGSERKKLFEDVGEKENNPMSVYRKLDDIMWLQSLMEQDLKKVGVSTNRDFLYKIHRYRKKRALKRLAKKQKRSKAVAESDDDRDSGVAAQYDCDSSSLQGGTSQSGYDEVAEDSQRMSVSLKKRPSEGVLEQTRHDDDDRLSISTFEEDADDSEPLSIQKKIKSLKVEPDFDRDLNEDQMSASSLPIFDMVADTDPLSPKRKNTTLHQPIEFEDRKPNINQLNNRLKGLVNISQPDSQETDPLSELPVVEPEPVPVVEPGPSRRPSDIIGESMDSYIFSDSNMDIYSAKLADERRESTSLASMQNALSKISCSPRCKARPFGVIDSMLAKLDSNVSLLGKMNKRNVLSEHTVIWSNEKMRFPDSEELSRIDVILNLDPALIKVGPINVYHKNRSFVYRCKIEDCDHFYTLSIDLLQRHVLAQHVFHSFDDWSCSDCGFVRMIDSGIRGIMKHLSEAHSLQATSQIAVGRLKSLNELILKDIQSVGDCPIRKSVGDPDACQLFQCCVPSCTFSTASSVNAINHFNIKLDGKVDFTCKYCSTLVNTAYGYAKHLLEQHGECQYKCGYCFYRGRTKSTVYFHQSISHQKPGKIFRCRIHTPLDKGRSIHDHNLKINLVQCRCPHCKFNTTILDKFKRHLTEMHPYLVHTCFLCRDYSPAAQKTGIIEHLLEHGIGDIQCRFCDQGFSNVATARNHFCREHPEKYPFVIVRHDYFGKSLARAQFSRVKEVPLGFESILAVDLGSDSVCEDQLQVIDMSETGNIDGQDIAEQLDYYFNPEKEFIILSDGPPKKSSLVSTIVAQPSSTINPSFKQTARKKTSPSPIKLVPLSRLVNEPKPPLPSTSGPKDTARKSTRPSPPVGPQFIPLLPKNSPKPQSMIKTLTPSFTKPSAPVFKIKPKVGKIQSVYSVPVQQKASAVKKISVINFKSPSINPPVSQVRGGQIVATKSPPSSLGITRLLKPATPLTLKHVDTIKQTARKHTGGPAIVTVGPSTSRQADFPVVVSSPQGSVQLKNAVRVINVSSNIPMSKAVSLVQRGKPSVSSQKPTNISIGGPFRAPNIIRIPTTNQELSIVPLPPRPKKKKDVI